MLCGNLYLLCFTRDGHCLTAEPLLGRWVVCPADVVHDDFSGGVDRDGQPAFISISSLLTYTVVAIYLIVYFLAFFQSEAQSCLI